MLNKNFNNVVLNKNLSFKFQKKKLCESVKINYFIKKNTYSSFKKFRYKELFFILSKFENYFGCLPCIKNINVRIKNKKKKIFSVNYVYISLIVNKNFKLFFDLFFIKNVFFTLFEIMSNTKFFDYSQELNFKIPNKKYQINCKSLSFNFIITSLYMNENMFKFLEKYKKKFFYFTFKLIFFGYNSKYILNFFNVFMINYSKFLIFYYKYFRNKLIRI